MGRIVLRRGTGRKKYKIETFQVFTASLSKRRTMLFVQMYGNTKCNSYFFATGTNPID